MTTIAHHQKTRFQPNRIGDIPWFKHPAILYPLAFLLGIYFFLFGWTKKNPVD